MYKIQRTRTKNKGTRLSRLLKKGNQRQNLQSGMTEIQNIPYTGQPKKGYMQKSQAKS